jgi:hypothetical protein
VNATLHPGAATHPGGGFHVHFQSVATPGLLCFLRDYAEELLEGGRYGPSRERPRESGTPGNREATPRAGGGGPGQGRRPERRRGPGMCGRANGEGRDRAGPQGG